MLITHPCPHYFTLYQNDVGTVALRIDPSVSFYIVYIRTTSVQWDPFAW